MTASPVRAGETERADVVFNAGLFTLDLEMRIHGDVDLIKSLLTDYDHLQEINASVVESARLRSPLPDVTIARIVAEECFFLYCARLTQVQEVREHADGALAIHILPERSDYKRGDSLWRFRQDRDGTTRVTVHAEMAPDLWIPPAIGTSLASNRMRERAVAMVERLEELAAASSLSLLH